MLIPNDTNFSLLNNNQVDQVNKGTFTISILEDSRFLIGNAKINNSNVQIVLLESEIERGSEYINV